MQHMRRVERAYGVYFANISEEVCRRNKALSLYSRSRSAAS